ncbi:hypothetical protein GCM10027029_12450 [Conyzicola lurida]
MAASDGTGAFEKICCYLAGGDVAAPEVSGRPVEISLRVDFFDQPEHLTAVLDPVVLDGRRAAIDLVEVLVRRW